MTTRRASKTQATLATGENARTIITDEALAGGRVALREDAHGGRREVFVNRAALAADPEGVMREAVRLIDLRIGANSHPSWCDPRGCDIADDVVDARAHHAHGEYIDLSLHDKWRNEKGATLECLPHKLAVLVQQHVSEREATLGVWAEAGGYPSGEFQVNLTRTEARALRDQLNHFIEVTA